MAIANQHPTIPISRVKTTFLLPGSGHTLMQLFPYLDSYCNKNKQSLEKKQL